MTGCAGSRVDLDTHSHARTIEEDRIAAGQGADKIKSQNISLSLEDAIRRGLAHNLDARVALLEALSQEDTITLAQLRALPGVEVSAGYTQRSNPGASSSRSINTGQQSLEPSQSTDEHRRTAALEGNWNLIDAALALSDAAQARDEAGVARERYAKVLQNVERDVYTAYWRAAIYQTARKRVGALLKETDEHLARLNRAQDTDILSTEAATEKAAQIEDRQRTLRDLHDRLSMAEVELKGMLSLPFSATLVLTSKPKDHWPDIQKILAEDVGAQEWKALQNRPEMREEILKKNMTLADTRREVIQSFPGLSLLWSRDYDSNSYLADINWSTFTASLTQSITSLITLPDRYRASKNKQVVADARRQALASALLAQVHIARSRLAQLEKTHARSTRARLNAARRAHAVAGRHKQGLASGQDALLAHLESEIEALRAASSYVDLQDAYAAMRTTLGKPVTSIGFKDKNGKARS